MCRLNAGYLVRTEVCKDCLRTGWCETFWTRQDVMTSLGCSRRLSEGVDRVGHCRATYFQKLAHSWMGHESCLVFLTQGDFSTVASCKSPLRNETFIRGNEKIAGQPGNFKSVHLQVCAEAPVSLTSLDESSWPTMKQT